MLKELEIGFKLRTQSSQDLSLQIIDIESVSNSIQSICFHDEALSMHIQHLQKLQQERIELISFQNNLRLRSNSHNLSRSSSLTTKPKSTSMKKSNKIENTSTIITPYNMTTVLSYQRCLNLGKNDRLNRAYGAMFGFVIGDCMGSNLANKSFNAQLINQAILMKGGGTLNLKSGQGSDQWEICYSLCQGLVQCKKVYNKNTIANKYLQWLDSTPFDLPVLFGISFSNIKKRRKEGHKIDKQNLGQELVKDSLRNIKQQSSLGLIRIIPLVIWGHNLEDYMFNQIVKEQMKLVTPNSFVQETALIFANILRCIMITGDHQLAYHRASQNIYNYGSQKMIQLWRDSEKGIIQSPNNNSAHNLKYPFSYAINQLLEIQNGKNDLKKFFIDAAVRVLSHGFNTDTNCSIVLGLIGAIIGYNNIPSYYRQIIINAQSNTIRKRNKHFPTKNIVDMVSLLIKQGPKEHDVTHF